MPSHRIVLPGGLDFSQSLTFVKELQSLPDVQEYHLDFKYLKWVEPFGMLYVSNELVRQIRKRLSAKFYTQNIDIIDNQAHGYAGHMGFFQSIGINRGNIPGKAKGNQRYLPITHLSKQELQIEANRAGISQIGAIVENKARQLAKMLTREQSGTLVDTVSYALRETMRNVIEHSRSETISYVAQYWPKRKIVEIAILDTGVGLKQTITTNPLIDVKNDREAINVVLIPGTSGKFYKGVPVENNNPWQNSGFGLYMIDRLCSHGGSFFICSGDTGLLHRPSLVSSTSKEYLDTNFQGTVLRLKLNTGQISNLRQSLGQFWDEGKVIARQYIGNQRLTASMASRMISEDFQLPTFRKHARIQHPEFGKGTVTEILFQHGETLLRVAFDNGRKTKVHPIKGHVILLSEKDSDEDELPF